MSDPIGTIRREQHGDGYSIWIRVPTLTFEELDVGHHWMCVWSTAEGNRGEILPDAALGDHPVIGVVPGTPAAEAAKTGGTATA